MRRNVGADTPLEMKSRKPEVTGSTHGIGGKCRSPHERGTPWVKGKQREREREKDWTSANSAVESRRISKPSSLA